MKNKLNYGAYGDGKTRITYPQTASPKSKPNISLHDTSEALQEQWMLRNLNVEIAISEGNRIIHDKVLRKIQLYSISSSNRRRFLMYLIRATGEKDTLTVTQATQYLGIARNSVETMVTECNENNWLTIKRCKKKHKHLTANDNLMDCYRGYSRWLWKQVNETGLRSLSEKMQKLEEIKSEVLND